MARGIHRWCSIQRHDHRGVPVRSPPCHRIPVSAAVLAFGPRLWQREVSRAHVYSVQLYTLREDLASDLMATIECVAAMGFENVELWRLEAYCAEYKHA